MGGMNVLPLDVSFNIFSRLHVELILDCKLVCKLWCNLIKNPSFAQIHLARHKYLLLQKCDENYSQDESDHTVQSGFFLLEKIGGNTHEGRLHYIEYNVDAEKMSYKIKDKTINIPPSKIGRLSNFTIGSCNGLICSTVRHHELDDPIHVCNPLTREYVYLPRYQSTGIYTYMVSGFVYSPSTGEYKVVRIYHKRDDTWCFQVYILGNKSNNWKEEKEIPHRLFHDVDGRFKGVFVNGEIHWLCNKASKIVAFSLTDEEFRCIDSPPLVEASSYSYEKRLCVLGDWLCLVHRKAATWLLSSSRTTHFNIWLFKRNNDISSPRNGAWDWNKEFTVEAETINPSLIPLAYTKERKVLFWQDFEFVSCYDTKTAILEKLISKDENDDIADLKFYPAAHHINSFVSLKSLGVRNCRRRLKYMGK